jgi:hypothetical protein
LALVSCKNAGFGHKAVHKKKAIFFPRIRDLVSLANLLASEETMGMHHSPTEEYFIKTTISQAMSNAAVAHDSPLKALLACDASIETTTRTAAVRVCDAPR